MKNDNSLTFKTLTRLQELTIQLEPLVVPAAVTKISDIRNELGAFAVKSSLVGQVKAGKTALTNAIIEAADLLPSDVNPWTSAVTSIHVNTHKPSGNKAVFKFFDADDWANMVKDGGRLAKMAKDASFDTEFNELRDQIKAMQKRTKSRLGDNFKLLLGNQHAFTHYSNDLIARYVCLGEEDKLSEKEGRFADMTKSADLFMDLPSFDYPITICDTPGVNDPFLVREAATLNTLGSSDLCVIVLNANQAFSTVDIALMRILLSLDSDQIILFVNRIDELDDPAKQVPEIEGYLRETLKDQGLPDTIPVVFGSASWAEAAIRGDTDCLSEDSLKAFEKAGADPKLDLVARLHQASGVQELRRVSDEKAAKNVVQPFVEKITARILEITNQSAAILKETYKETSPIRDDASLDTSVAALTEQIQAIQTELDALRGTVSQQLMLSMSGVFTDFLHKEGRALEAALGSSSALKAWTPDTEALRRQLNIQYDSAHETAQKDIKLLTLGTSALIGECYDAVLTDEANDIEVNAPKAVPAQTPVCLMRTMSVDLSSTWLTGWLRRKLNKKAYVEKFNKIVLDEMRDVVSEIQTDYLETQFAAQQKSLVDFVGAHIDTLQSMAGLDTADGRSDVRTILGVANDAQLRSKALVAVLDELNTFLPTQKPETAEMQEASKYRKVTLVSA